MVLGEPSQNLLPFDGEVFYIPNFLDQEARHHFKSRFLEAIPWENDQVFLFGKHFVLNRKVAWYGDHLYAYTYSKTTKLAIPWTKDLLIIKQSIEALTKETFNCCLLNLYHSGADSMGYHCDNEKELKENGTIASLSLGACRTFRFKHKTSKKSFALTLEDGSLLLMKGETQKYWLHSLPKSSTSNESRINLTFRTIIGPSRT